MNPYVAIAIGLIAGAAAGLCAAWILTSRQRNQFERLRAQQREQDLTEHQRIRKEAADQADQRIASEKDTLKSAQKAEQDVLKSLEQKIERMEAKLGDRERQVSERETGLDRRVNQLDQREQDMRGREKVQSTREADIDRDAATLQTQHKELEAKQADIAMALERVAGLSQDQAKAELLQTLDADLDDVKSKRLARHEKDLTARSKEMSIEVISRAIQRYAAEHTADTTTNKVPIKEEELKGRIIGKEGRNIKAFEQAAGVDLIVDETPGFIIVSCFSGLRREIARRALEILLEDGRVHPARIEEVLNRVQSDMDREVMRLGEDAAFACDVSGLHPQLLKLLGKLQWRTSYGQNVLKHTQEVAFLCGAMAADMGLDPRMGRRCGLMHDIGKAIDHEQEGSHPVLGYEALKRFNESEIVANAALAHHEGHEVLTAYTVLAAAADAISAARPGARRENTERYLKRLAQLEEIACSFKGVQKAYAIQAGRELRVIINGHSLSDNELGKVAHDIAKRVEGEVTFPGEVKVTLIRETRSTAVAR